MAATKIGELQAVVSADISKLKVGLNRATAEIKGFSVKSQGFLKANAAQIGQLGRKFMMAGAAISAGLAIGVKSFGTFDQAMRKATAVSDVTEKQFKQMSDTVEKKSKELGIAAEKLAEGYYFLGSAGLSATEQMAAFPAVAVLSKAALIDMGQAAEMVVDIMKGFKIPFTDTTRVTDILTEAVTSSNMVFSQLGEAIGYVAGVARTANTSLEETTAIIGVMADVGMKGSRAGVALRRAFLNLMAPTETVRKSLDKLGKDGSSADKAKDAMKDLGIQVYGTDGKMKSMIEIMKTLIPALNSASEQTRNMALKNLFGARAVTGMIAVIDEGVEGLEKWVTQLENSGGAAQRVADKQLAAFNEQLGNLGKQIKAISRDVGAILVPALLKIIEKIEKLVEWVGELNPDIKKMGVFAAVVAGVLLPLPQLIKLFLPMESILLQ